MPASWPAADIIDPPASFAPPIAFSGCEFQK
jgi:hypothetical protein